MSSEHNKVIVKKFFSEFSAGRTDEAFEHVAADVAWWVPGTLPFSGMHDKATYMNIVRRIRDGFPDGFALVVTGLVAEDDRVAAEVESQGRHLSGKEYRNKYHFLFTLRDGRVTAVKEYMDTLHLYQLMTP